MHNRPSPQTSPGFHGLGIAPALLEAVGRLRFTEPTPIQRQAIPPAMEGKDVVGIAQTGTGKTLAFGLPMLQRLAQSKKRGLVVLPTRELALQVDEMLRAIGQPLGLRTAVLIGGLALGPQVQAIRKNPHVIIATPGRLIDHLQQKTIRLDEAAVVVLDEADRMLDMGFAPQIQKIFAALPRERQTMLFSATMPAEIMKMASAHMRLPIRVEIAPPGTTVERVAQELFIVEKSAKNRLVELLLREHRGPALIFTRTKHGAKRLMRAIRAMGEVAAEIHSNRSLNQRRDALDGFKTGRYRVLVATDIASRGIDVTGIELVINYDLPTNAEDYVHRIGRTARAGAGGLAVSLAMPDQRNEVRAIERLIRKPLAVRALPDHLPPPRPAALPAPFAARHEHSYRHRPQIPQHGRGRGGGFGHRRWRGPSGLFRT